MKRARSCKFEIFDRQPPSDSYFTIAPPLPIIRDVPLPERLEAFKAMKRKIAEFGRNTPQPGDEP